ncbi:MAG TPA: hypothetical protein V6D17_03850, partial [Candidatus Obscuribacterales bacterium]
NTASNDSSINNRNFEIIKSLTKEELAQLGLPTLEAMIQGNVITGERLQGLKAEERPRFAENILDAVTRLDAKGDSPLKLQMVDKLLRANISNQEAAKILTWVADKDPALLKQYNDQAQRALEELHGQDADHIKRQIEKVVDKAARDPLEPQAINELLRDFTPEERQQLAKILEERKQYLTMDGLGEMFENLAKQIETHNKEFVGKKGKGADRHTLQEINVVVLGDATVGNALAYLYRKRTGVNLNIHFAKDAHTLQELASNKQLVLFDPLSHASAEMRAQLQALESAGQVMIPAELQGFSHGPNLFDIALAESSKRKANSGFDGMRHLKETLRDALPQGSPSKSGTRGGGQDLAMHELNNFWHLITEPARANRELIRAKAYDFVMQLKNRSADEYETKPNLKEAVDMLALAEHVSFGDMVNHARDLHQKLERAAQGKGKELVFVTDMDNGGSTHLVAYLYRLANGLSDKSHDVRFTTYADAIERVRRARDGNGKEPALVYLDDYIYTGTQVKSKVEGLLGKPEIAELRPDIIFATLGYQRAGSARFSRFLTNGKHETFTIETGYRLKTALERIKESKPNVAKVELIPYLKGLINKDVLSVEWGAKRNRFVEPGYVSSVVLPYMVPNDNIGMVNTFWSDYMGRPRASSQRKYYGVVEERALPAEIEGQEAAPRKGRKKPNEPMQSDTAEHVWFGGAPNNAAEFRKIQKKTEADIIIDLTGKAKDEGDLTAYKRLIAKESDRARRSYAERYVLKNIEAPIELPARGSSDLTTFVRANPGYGQFLKDFHRFRQIIEQAGRDGKKVYVHCYYGQDRTGLMMAMYDVIQGGKPIEAAIEGWRALKKQGEDSSFKNLFRSEQDFRQLIEDYRSMESSGEFERTESRPKPSQGEHERAKSLSDESTNKSKEASGARSLGDGIYFPSKPTEAQLRDMVSESFARMGLTEAERLQNEALIRKFDEHLRNELQWRDRFADMLERNLERQNQALERYSALRENAARELVAKEGLSIAEARERIDEMVRSDPQSTDPLHYAFKEYKMWRDEYARQLKGLKPMIQRRQLELIKALNKLKKDLGVPEVIIFQESDLGDAYAFYWTGTGAIKMSEMDILRASDQKVMRRIYHELVHLSQDTQIVRAIAQEVRAEQTRGNVIPHPQALIPEIQAKYKQWTGGKDVMPMFVEKVLAVPENNRPMTKEQVERAKALAKSFGSIKKSNLDALETDYLVTQSRMFRMERATEQALAADTLLKDLTEGTGAQLRQRLFGTREVNELPAEVRDVISEWTDSQRNAAGQPQNWDGQKAYNVLMRHMQKRLDQINAARKADFDRYYSWLHEQEAHLIEKMLERFQEEQPQNNDSGPDFYSRGSP